MNIRKLSPELVEKAKENLGESPDRVQNDINDFRSWIEKQPHLISRKDDQFFVTFLRRCNFSLEESKKRVDAFLTCKSTYPDIFKNRFVDATALEILKCGLITIPPNPLPNNGPKLLISHFSKFNPKKHSLKDVMKVRFMLFELLAFEDDFASINGVELVIDLKNCTLQQALYLEPSLLRKTFVYQEQCIPLRINHIHIINMKKEIQGIVQLARSFVSSSKTQFEIILHDNESDLYKHIPQEFMPAEYGGKNGSQEKFLEEWEKMFLDHVEYFENDALHGTNEKLRSEPSRFSQQNDFGVEGSFRMLELD